MPCKFSMIFSGIFEDLGTEDTVGEPSTRPQERRAPPCRARPLSRGPLLTPLNLCQHPHTPSSTQKNAHPAQARVLARFAAIFDLLAQSSIHKTALGDCCLVCDSSIGQISFCSSALFIANFCYIRDHVLELAC